MLIKPIPEYAKPLLVKAINVVTGKLTIEVFEKELYNCITVFEKDGLCDFTYDLCEINFTKENSHFQLLDILKRYVSSEELLANKLLARSYAIIELDAKESNLIYKHLLDMLHSLQNSNLYFYLYWSLYMLIENFNIQQEGIVEFKNNELEHAAKEEARNIIDLYEESKKQKDWDILLKHGELSSELLLSLEKDQEVYLEQYVTQAQINFKGKKKIEKALTTQGYSQFQIDEVFKKTKSQVKKRSRERAPIYLILGIVFSVVGVIGLSKGYLYTTNSWIFAITGVVSIYTGINFLLK